MRHFCEVFNRQNVDRKETITEIHSAQEVDAVWKYLSQAEQSTGEDSAVGISRRHTMERKTSEQED